MGYVVSKCADSSCGTMTGTPISSTVDVNAVGTYGGAMTIGADGMPIIAYNRASPQQLVIVKCQNQFCVSGWSRR